MREWGGAPQRSGKLHRGTILGTPRGFGFFRPDGGAEDWYVSAEDLHGAMHGDTVLCRRVSARRSGISGAVERIEQRAWETLVCTVHGGRCVPDERRIPLSIVPLRGGCAVREGDRVLVHIERYAGGQGAAQQSVLGRVVEVLGHAGEAGADVRAAVKRFGLSEDFPERVRCAASALPQTVSDAQLSARLDLRGLLTVTIDGAHSKDFDDAVSLEPLGNGNVRLGVHIADVCAYVRAGSAIDREARRRGTSVYFADRVLPMLPEELSNGISSLNEGVDRLTISCLMEVDANGNVVRHTLSESVIRSRHRLIYEDVTALLAGDAQQQARYADAAPMLFALADLEKRLYAKRKSRGSIDFELAESEITFDEAGHAVELAPAERGAADRIIESCMLLANETVAGHLRQHRLPCLYRVHEPPDRGRLEELAAFLGSLGYGLAVGDPITPHSLQRVLEQTEGSPEARIVSRLLLRAMQRARYSDRPLGHFGLALEDYCHFTSPIRRYPDLTVHRILKRMLHGSLDRRAIEHFRALLPALGEETSRAERTAMEAEQTVLAAERCAVMRRHLGEVYDGVISGVTGSGFYVELSNTAEGFVHLVWLTEDRYRFEPANYRLVGVRTGRIYRLGDRVRVQVARVDTVAAVIDLQPKIVYNMKRIYDPARKGGRKHGRKARNKTARSKQKGKA